MPDDFGPRPLGRIMAGMEIARRCRRAVLGCHELRLRRTARVLAHDAADNGLNGEEFDAILTFMREQFRARTTEIASRRDREARKE